MTKTNVFEIVGRVTKDVTLTKSKNGQAIAHCHIAVERGKHSKSNHSVYMTLYAGGKIAQAMAHKIGRGMYVKFDVDYQENMYKPDLTSKAVWLASYHVQHFEKLDKPAYANCGQISGQILRLHSVKSYVRAAIQTKNGLVFVKAYRKQPKDALKKYTKGSKIDLTASFKHNIIRNRPGYKYGYQVFTSVDHVD